VFGLRQDRQFRRLGNQVSPCDSHASPKPTYRGYNLGKQGVERDTIATAKIRWRVERFPTTQTSNVVHAQDLEAVPSPAQMDISQPPAYEPSEPSSSIASEIQRTELSFGSKVVSAISMRGSASSMSRSTTSDRWFTRESPTFAMLGVFARGQLLPLSFHVMGLGAHGMQKVIEMSIVVSRARLLLRRR
jgi:hypothetical protein